MAKSISKMMAHAVGVPQIIAKESLLKSLDEMLEQFEYDIKRAKAPNRKRQLFRAMEFYSSIKWHLKNGKEVLNG